MVDSFYEDAKLTANKVNTWHTIMMGDLNAKVGGKQICEHAVGNSE